MSTNTLPEIEGQPGQQAAEEWRLILRHFELSEGFALLILTVPDRVVADLCRDDLTSFLVGRGKRLERIEFSTPEDLDGLPIRLLALPDDPALGAVWVEAVSSERAETHGAWNEAWHNALGSMNQQRNPLRRHLHVPLLIVVAPWVATVMRETAPDLWSVRSFVARVEPVMAEQGAEWEQQGRDVFASEHGQGDGATPDPFLAERTADQLRGRRGQERVLADVVARTAQGFAGRQEWQAAKAAWLEAIELRRQFGPPEEAARALSGLAAIMRHLGQREEAFAAAEEAVSLYRTLSTQRPDAFQPTLAGSLNNLGAMLSSLGRREEALAAAAEAVSLYRTLSAQRPGAFGPDLAGSLNNLGNMLSALGRREEALAAAAEPVSLYRMLSAQRPDAFHPDLAMSFNNVANTLSALGRREEALAAAAEAVSLYRTLSVQRPDAFRPNLAGSINNVANRLAALGRRDEALAAAAEAVSLYRMLSAQRPDAFRPGLADSLNNLANTLSSLARRDEALAAAAEAVSLRRTLSAQRPDAFRPDLAASLNNLANRLIALGRREEALAAAEEAISFYRTLSAQRPGAFRPDLPSSLNTLGNVLSELGRREEALAAAEEAVSLYRTLSAQRPDASRPDLSTSLRTLASCLDALARPEEGLAANVEAIRILTQSFLDLPSAFADRIGSMAKDYIDRCEKLGQRPDEALLAPITSVFNQLKTTQTNLG